MCGIFGVFSTGGKPLDMPADSAAAALGLLRHRGPDAAGLMLFSPGQPPKTLNFPLSGSIHDGAPSGILGHVRLAILDRTSAGNQPMSGPTPNARYTIAYNGEIYNYRELRAELQAQGYIFQTQGDTEVLLALYDAHGPAMLNRLNGMFALAIWDTGRESLFLARDRYGIKPLYHTRLPDGTFAFASESKALLALPGCPRGLNPHALSEHLTFQNTFGGKTLAEGTEVLEPAHWAVFDTQSGSFQIHRYWEPVFHEADFDAKRFPALAEELRHLLKQAVQRQLAGDVPIGSFLSGGLDTGTLAALASQSRPGLHTYTCGFDFSGIAQPEPLEAFFDERDAARQLATYLGTTHHELTLEAASITQVLPQVVWHLDDFRAGISYQNYLTGALVKQSATVALSGVSGDELLAGYPWRHAPLLSSQNPAEFEAGYYQSWVKLLDEPQKARLFTPAFRQRVGDYDSREAFRQELGQCRATHPLNKALAFEMRTFLHGLLVLEDRLSMAHGVESRVPFLDNDLVDFCLRLPVEAKLTLASDGQPIAKRILREAMQGLLPDEVLNRRKQGFTPPDASWYRGPTRAFVESILLSEQALDRGLFTRQALQGLLEAHFNAQANHRFLIWSLLCLETWQRLFLDTSQPVPPAPLLTVQ